MTCRDSQCVLVQAVHQGHSTLTTAGDKLLRRLQADIVVNLLTGVEDQEGNRDYSLPAIA